MAAGGPAGALGLSVLVLLLDLISCQSLPRFGSIGGNITLSPSSTENFTEAIWKKGKDKVAEWSVNLEFRTYPLFKGKVYLNNKSGDLTILNLTSSDEGEYECEILFEDHPKVTKFHLTVLDPLPSPTLTCRLVNETIVFSCEVSQSYRQRRDLLRYAWRCPSEQCRGKSGLSELPELSFKKNDDLSQEIRCSVENSESSRTSSSVLSACVPPENSRHRYILIAVPFLGIMFVIGLLMCARGT